MAAANCNKFALCSGTVLAALAFLLLAASAPRADGVIMCGAVASDVSPCISYVQGMPGPSAQCCGGVKRLLAAITTTADRQAACTCLKALAGKITGLKPPLAAGLPGKCGVSSPFPISTSTDCSKVR